MINVVKKTNMKHLVAQEHHPHLKKRALLEMLGLIVLVVISVSQRDLIQNAFMTIRRSDVLYLLLMVALYWSLLPLTTFSYQLLAHKKIPIMTTMLAQMAAAGPGRIIPGGLGHISIGAMHLKNVGMTMRKALVISIANNVIGLFVNLLLVAIAFIYHPDILEKISSRINIQTILIFFLVAIIVTSVFLWLSHAHSTRRTIAKMEKHWRHLTQRLLHHPERILLLLVIATTIIAGNVLLLILAGEAIGENLSVLDGLIALSVGVFIGGAIPTPGGLGAVEAGTASALIVLGYDAAAATSMALLFRTITYWQPLLPGLIAYLYLRERKLL